MQNGKHAGTGDGKQRHRLCKAIDGVAPRLPQEKKNGGNQSSRVPDSNPPHEIDNGKPPAHRDVHTPDTASAEKEIADRIEQPHADKEREAKPKQPTV